MVRVAQSFKPLLVLLKDNAVLAVVVHHLHNVQAQDGVFVGLYGAWLAAVCLHETAACKIEGDTCVENVRKKSAGNGDKERRVSHCIEVRIGIMMEGNCSFLLGRVGLLVLWVQRKVLVVLPSAEQRPECPLYCKRQAEEDCQIRSMSCSLNARINPPILIRLGG